MTRESWETLAIGALFVVIEMGLAVPSFIVAANPAHHDALYYVAMGIGIAHGALTFPLIAVVASGSESDGCGGCLRHALMYLEAFGSVVLSWGALQSVGSPSLQVPLVQAACWTFIAGQVTFSASAAWGTWSKANRR